MADTSPLNPPGLPSRDWFVRSVLSRPLVWGVGLMAIFVFSYVGRAFSIPTMSGYTATLLDGSPLTNVLAVAVVYLALVGIVTTLADRIRPGIGLFVASFGLAGISIRGGTLSDLLRHTSGNAYPVLMIEIVLLAAMVCCGAIVQTLLSRTPPIQEMRDEEGRPTLVAKLMSAGLQAGVTAALVYFLAATDSKGQALAAVGFASLLATFVSDNALPVGMTPLAIIAPFVVGVFGYVWASASGAANPLANVLPLDYASFGVAGTMLGHWTSQQWREESEIE